MNSALFAVCTIGITAGIFVLYFFIDISRKWFETHWLKRHGTEATARILETQVINEAGRYLPFVRLKLEIRPVGKESFHAEVKSLVPGVNIQDLMADNYVRIKYNPRDASQVRLVKDRNSTLALEDHPWQPAGGQLSLAQ